MLELKKLNHYYGEHNALKNIDLEIRDGEIFGIIGHNGAGKSTMIKSIVSILDYSEGDIIVDGQNLKEHREEIKKKIGYVSDSPDMFLRLQCITYWNLIAEIFQVENMETKLNALLEIFNMKGQEFKFIEELSHGMRQKVFLIGAILPNPRIWILDEPMTGLDPQAAFDLKNMMREHADSGNIVLFSTHVLEVAEKLCDRIAILKDGNLLFVGTVDELKKDNTEMDLEAIYLSLINR